MDICYTMIFQNWRHNRILKLNFKVIIGLAVFYVLYLQLSEEKFKESFNLISQVPKVQSIWMFILLFLLMLLNWGLEAFKWFLIMKNAYTIKFLDAFKAVLVGNTYGIFTPNRVGEIVGRVFYIPNLNKSRVAMFTLLGSSAMSIAGLILAVIALFIYPIEIHDIWLWLSILALILAVICFLKIVVFIRWISKFRWWKKYADYSSTLKLINTPKQLFYVLLSLVRYLVFIFQYILLLDLIIEDLPYLEIGAGLSLIYMIQSFVPTPVIVELGVRGNLAVLILSGLIGGNAMIIVSVAYIIWFINMLIPALIGYIFVLRKK